MAFTDFLYAAVGTIGPLFGLLTSSPAAEHPNGFILASRTGFSYLYYCAAKTLFEIVGSSLDALVMGYMMINNKFAEEFDYKSRIAGLSIGWAIAHAFTFEAVSFYSPLLGETPYGTALSFAVASSIAYLGIATAIAHIAHFISRKNLRTADQVNRAIITSCIISALPSICFFVVNPLVRKLSGSPLSFQGVDEDGQAVTLYTANAFDGINNLGGIIYTAICALCGVGAFIIGNVYKTEVLSKPTKFDAVGEEANARKAAKSLTDKAMSRYWK